MMKFKELRNQDVAASATIGNKEPLVTRVRNVLAGPSVNRKEREGKALSMLLCEIEKRGGKLEIVGTEGVKKITCALSIPAGIASSSKLVKVGDNGQVDTILVKKVNDIDGRIVDAAIGFGMGVLDVFFKTTGNECFYVIRTNGSRACLEENKVNVALALVGAATIAEEMLEAKKNKEVKKSEEAKDAPKLIGLKKAA